MPALSSCSMKRFHSSSNFFASSEFGSFSKPRWNCSIWSLNSRSPSPMPLK
ncbi:hypothetical protein [Methylogaea oryzae]|uniref:hypothetical protein n=1 Tax=Methylogaea oryzae TaxID=1295382 RepID=UPI0012E19F7A|nr:hypothetical protein [Methylogaea oryzae]